MSLVLVLVLVLPLLRIGEANDGIVVVVPTGLLHGGELARTSLT